MNSTNTTLEELKNMTRDELSDAIRAHINKIVPRPLGGFASSGEEAAHIARREDQWIWINRLPRATIINTILGY